MSAEKKKTTPLGKSEGAEPERFIPDGMGMFQRNVKRIGDCALAFLALIVFSPLFLLCYIAVKREDGGPAIFKQERIGRFGRPFNIYKFRSMRLDAEKFGPALYKGGADPPDDPCRKIPPGTSLGRAAPVMECLRGRHVLYRSPSRA